MMGYPDLDAWFYGLDAQQLMCIFTWYDGDDAYQFLDSCNETWSNMDEEKRYALFLKVKNLI